MENKYIPSKAHIKIEFGRSHSISIYLTLQVRPCKTQLRSFDKLWFSNTLIATESLQSVRYEVIVDLVEMPPEENYQQKMYSSIHAVVLRCLQYILSTF